MAPPDLSVVGRSRGTEWLYNFLIGFYRDTNGNWNNALLANAAMPIASILSSLISVS